MLPNSELGRFASYTLVVLLTPHKPLPIQTIRIIHHQNYLIKSEWLTIQWGPEPTSHYNVFFGASATASGDASFWGKLNLWLYISIYTNNASSDVKNLTFYTSYSSLIVWQTNRNSIYKFRSPYSHMTLAKKTIMATLMRYRYVTWTEICKCGHVTETMISTIQRAI